MKQLFMILGAAILLYACTGSKISDQAQHSTHQQHETGYSCPMHPEITGKKGDRCEKCGMKLEPTAAPPAVVPSFFMEFVMQPQVAEPWQDVELSFTPKQKGAANKQVPLEVEHEKKIHLILVNNDLSWFDHIHPEYTPGGSYKVTERFPAPGTYTAFADYKPAGAGHVVDKFSVNVKGTAPAPVNYPAAKLTGTSGRYGFTLRPSHGSFTTGAPMQFAGIVTRDGKELDASQLDNYLGAKAHFVMVSLDDKEYLHVHPNVTKGRFDLHTTFEKPGIYRGWVQFNADGVLHTIDFTIHVEQGSGQPSAAKGDAVHAHHKH